MHTGAFHSILKISVILVFILFLAHCEPKENVQLTVDAVDESAGDVPAYKIETPIATYYLEKEGVGLSSMIDRNGNDWISFHKKPGSGAGGEYRGFPNAVHRQDGNFFHPRNQSTQVSATSVEYEGPDRVTITGTSGNGNWKCRWDFYPERCDFTMTRMAPGYKYWILYEGTPGGEYNETDWWITSAIEEKTPLTTDHDGDIPDPEWIAFGDKDLNRVIYLAHHQDDNESDRFYQMQKKMTVFGFGREGLTKFLDTVPRRFSIGFIESAEYSEIAREIRQVFLSE